MRRVVFHFDPSCPWTWLTDHWLRQVAAKEGFAVELAPFSLAHVERDDAETWSVDQRDKRESGQAILRIVHHLLVTGDTATADLVYDEMGGPRPSAASPSRSGPRGRGGGNRRARPGGGRGGGRHRSSMRRSPR